MHSRRGFTLVELLVVIAIIGILVALLIPAVQSAREAGRRITCANHMKQFALAVANYTTVHNDRLPPMAMAFFGPSGRRPLRESSWPCDAWSELQSPGWRVAVLPFLEEQRLYDQFDFSRGVVTEANHPAISQVLPGFQCPSTPGYPRSVRQADWGVSGRAVRDVTVGAWDYGVPVNYWSKRDENGEIIAQIIPAWNGAKDPPRTYEVWADGRLPQTCYREVWFGRQARLVWVTDGLSKTTVAYEIAYKPNLYRRAGLRGWSNEGEPLGGTTWPVTHGTGWAETLPHQNLVFEPINSSNVSNAQFSFHPGGVNNAFLDGSVRFLEESTDLLVLRATHTRSGGETISLLTD